MSHLTATVSSDVTWRRVSLSTASAPPDRLSMTSGSAWVGPWTSWSQGRRRRTQRFRGCAVAMAQVLALASDAFVVAGLGRYDSVGSHGHSGVQHISRGPVDRSLRGRSSLCSRAIIWHKGGTDQEVLGGRPTAAYAAVTAVCTGTAGAT